MKRNKYCQAQPKLQVKLSLKAELALFSLDPPTHPTQYVAEAPVYVAESPHPTHPGKSIFQHFSVNDEQVSLQEYFLGKCKTLNF